VYPYRQFVEVGGLLSYGNDLRDNYRRAATYTDRILRGVQSDPAASNTHPSNTFRNATGA
jgi:hypothetical protein